MRIVFHSRFVLFEKRLVCAISAKAFLIPISSMGTASLFHQHSGFIASQSAAVDIVLLRDDNGTCIPGRLYDQLSVNGLQGRHGNHAARDPFFFSSPRRPRQRARPWSRSPFERYSSRSWRRFPVDVLYDLHPSACLRPSCNSDENAPMIQIRALPLNSQPEHSVGRVMGIRRSLTRGNSAIGKNNLAGDEVGCRRREINGQRRNINRNNAPTSVPTIATASSGGLFA